MEVDNPNERTWNVGDVIWTAANGELTNTPQNSSNTYIGEVISFSPSVYTSDIFYNEYACVFGKETAIERIKNIVDKMYRDF